MIRRLAALLAGLPAVVLAAEGLPPTPANVTLDLATREGVAAVQGTWRTHDARLVEVAFRAVGPDRKPGTVPNRTLDVEPAAGAGGFDDSTWPVIDPATLDARRAAGKVCFEWYRFHGTLPERVNGVPVAGATVVFEVTVDDYAEVWVDGQLPRELGQSGGTVAAGFNVPNRVVIMRDARPGQAFDVAVFGINGPISAAPENYVWVRSAKLGFHIEPHAVTPASVAVTVDRLDPALDAIVPAGATLEKLAEGFLFGEGPVWAGDGTLLFSDPNGNRIYRWSERDGMSVFREQSGYAGADVALYGQPGSNGLTLDPQGHLIVCEHGNRRVSRLLPDGSERVLADRFGGRRLNSPNDVVCRSDGAVFFTDPPFGLPEFHADPRRELDFTGVFCLRGDELTVVSRDLRGPNGLAFSPDERTLYVTNWDEAHKVVMRWDVAKDGTARNGRVFFDMGAAPEPEALDGMKVDRKGNLYVSGPGGVWILSEDGRHLGTIRGPELPANFAWGDADARTLYFTARTGLYRMRLGIPGIRPEATRLASLEEGR